MDKTKATVTMPLPDYEKLDWYKDAYDTLIGQIRNAAYIGLITSQDLEIVVDKQKIGKILATYMPEDWELCSFPYKDIKFTWEGETRVSVTKPEILELLNGLHYAATSAKEGKLSQQSLDDQFNLIKETVSKWEDGQNKKPLSG